MVQKVTGSFTAVGVSSHAVVDADGELTYLISGTYIATVVLEKATTSSRQQWTPITVPLLSGATGSVAVRAQDVLRMRCTAYTSGTANYTVSTPALKRPAAVTTAATAATYNLDMSGAVGDGVTDDASTIQTFLTQLAAVTGGAQVDLTPGKFYYIGAAPLTVPSGVMIVGAYSAQDNQAAGGTFFGGGGFLVNPALTTGIVMSGKSSLKNLKVYRSGLTANASAAKVATDVAVWAAEAFYRKTSGAMLINSNVIPLASTAGITVGMNVTGLGGVGLGGNPATVVSIVANTSVTISSGGVNAAIPAGRYFRFGGSVGITLPYNQGAVIIEGVTVVGFRTGIQALCAQFWIEHYVADCITCFEGTSGGDVQTMRDSEFLPLYGIATGNADRPGDAVFLNGDAVTQVMDNVFPFGWLVGFHVANAQTTAFNCGTECFGGAGTIGWWMEGGAQSELVGCHAQAEGIGFYLNNATYYLLQGCTSAGVTTSPGDNIAHFFVDGAGGTYGAIASPTIISGSNVGKVPVKFGTVSGCTLTNPAVFDMAGATPTVPYIQGSLPNTTSPPFAQGVGYHAVSTGATVTLAWYETGAIIDSGGTMATHTVVLPIFPMDRQLVRLWFNVAVTTLTISTTDGTAVGAVQNPVAGSAQTWIYSFAQNKWFG